MVCIYCGGSTQVKNSRLQKRGNHIWRRRQCSMCASIFTTEERPTLDTALAVKTGQSGKLAAFNRDKLFLAIYEACRHRDDALRDAAYITEVVATQILEIQTDGTIDQQDIIRAATKALERFDRTAAVVYSAYHPA